MNTFNYGIEGSSRVYQFGEGIEVTSPYILMQAERPNDWAIAQADGTWLDTPELQAAWEAAQGGA